MAYVEQDSLDLNRLKAMVKTALEDAGFAAFEEYTDFESRGVESCLAVWAVSGLNIEQAGHRVINSSGAFRGEIGFQLKLMGHYGNFDDYDEFDDRCFTLCAALACLRSCGRCGVKLGAARSDMQQRRITRYAEVVFKVCMKEE